MFDRSQALEKYSSGSRGAPAKGVGRETGARVQIPLSPLHLKHANFLNLLLQMRNADDIIGNAAVKKRKT